MAADGKLCFATEEGDVYVVKAGTEFKVLSVNPMKDPCLATPAVSEGILYFRTMHSIAAVQND